MTTTNLPEWFPQFQNELNDDINNGAKIDWTRKPGVYVIAYDTKETCPEEEADEYVFIDDCDEYTPDKFIQLLAEHDPVDLIYKTSCDETGLNMGLPCSCGEYCQCDPIEFDSLDDTQRFADNQPHEFNQLKKSLYLEKSVLGEYKSLTELRSYARDNGIDASLIPVRNTQRYREEQFFLTRKSCERHLTKHGHKYEGTGHHAYAQYPYRNDEYMRLIAFLASIDLDKSTIIIDQDRYDYLKDR
ncbi:hypothetical protein G7Y41_08855 [Schaalia sp. ZJ405]|uniref:hypothetical protein n=1 Tax=Schaalia sp. ZJ405 TaxID=2709403 RepID=UPI0013ED3DC7|nr:hypothetical protein [Schaalia sp. ZJ405]QPK81134.1 hypothetical protein G7Y41_08855 [Schaalia sp. ZJ405]